MRKTRLHIIYGDHQASGKTLLANGLAAVLSGPDKKVLIVDSDYNPDFLSHKYLPNIGDKLPDEVILVIGPEYFLWVKKAAKMDKVSARQESPHETRKWVENLIDNLMDENTQMFVLDRPMSGQALRDFIETNVRRHG